ncbi:MAG: hypothetical protein ABR503_04330 [Chitinophagaceae bacterium]
MIKTFCLFLLIITSSCSFLNGFKRRQFQYRDNSSFQEIALLIPKGFNGEKKNIDSAGNQQQSYSYENGAVLYFAFLSDTTKEYQPILEERHITRLHPAGGYYYKGRDSNGLYWRELRQNNFRAGYKNISPEIEAKFDSAINYAGYKRPR